MKKWITAGLVFGILLVGRAHPADTTQLKPKEVYGKEAQVIIQILNSYHFSKIKFDDSLSSRILDSYVANLDDNRSYFLESDVKGFEKFRYQLDDLTKLGDLAPGYEIYTRFQQRINEREAYVMNTLVNLDHDFTVDEYYEFDREKSPWAKTPEELNDIWRKILKNQALGLKLTGKSSEEIKSILRKRFELSFKRKATTEDVFGAYMNTITQAYDPHTDYFSPRDAQRFREDLSVSLEGIGARLQSDNEYIKINEVLPGGPAEKSGRVHVNDRIVGVAQGDEAMVDIIGWRVDDAVKLIKGPKGTKVRLQILPAETGINGPTIELTLIREKIKLEDLSAKKSVIMYERDGKPMKFGVITLPSFYLDWDEMQKGNPNYNSTTKDVKKLIAELQVEGVNGIMLDLRNNGGGSLAEAIDLTGLFIKNGPVVQVKNSANRIEVGADEDNAVVYSGPLVVMINRFSASASEIFAGAIQDYKRGIIVGESSYGKGTVQQVYPLNRFIPDANDKTGELKLTLQKFYRVTGSSTQHKGVTPDILFPSALDVDQFGESSRPSALPWDEIPGTLFNKTTSVNDRVLNALAKSYNERLKNDVNLKRFVDETNESRKSISLTKISLNEATRKAEMEEAEKKKAANNQLGVRITGKENKPVLLLDLEDEYLRESLLVLGDLINSKIG